MKQCLSFFLNGDKSMQIDGSFLLVESIKGLTWLSDCYITSVIFTVIKMHQFVGSD